MAEQELSPQKRAAIKRKKRKAGKKGYETRIKNREAKKRSDAAKKAVATRRAKRFLN